MCEYCSCRQDEGPISRLAAEHEGILAAVESVERASMAGDATAVTPALAELQALVERHDAHEEPGFYAALAQTPGMAEAIARMTAEHRGVQAVLDRAVEEGPDGSLTAALTMLREHIFREEYDLFPASLVTLDFDAWRRVAAAMETGIAG